MYKFLIYVLLTVPPIVFFTDLTRNPYYFQIVFLNALTVFLWMWFLYRGIVENKITLKTSSIELPLFAFFAIATVSWLFNLYENYNDLFLRYSAYSEGYKRWLFLLVNAVLVYYIPLNFVDAEFREKTFGVLFFVGFVASGYGILQFLGIEFIWPKLLNPFGGRSVSTFGNPNFLSSYLVILLPVLFVHYLTVTKSSSVFLYFIYIVTFFTCLIVTLTRSSWLGALAAFAVFFAFADKKMIAERKQRLFFLAAVLAIIILFWPHPKSSEKYTPAIFDRLKEIATYGENVYGPVHQRQLIWSCAWHMITDHPIIGRGWGLFELFYPYYQGKYLFVGLFKLLRTHANNAHNEILEIWSQTGIIGFGIYLWFLVTLFTCGYQIWKASSGHQKMTVLALAAGILGMLVDNLLNVSLHFAVPAFLYWWMIGVMMSFTNPGIKEIPLKSIFSKASAAFLIVCGAFLIIRYYNNFMGEINYFSGFKLSKRGDVSGALPYLKRAHEYQRFEVNNNYELANTYARLNMKEKAIDAYEEALKANAGYDEIFFNMATVYSQLGKPDLAVRYYSEALAINPLSYEAYMALGSIYMSDIEKYADNALKLFEQAYIFFPGNKDLANNIGYLYTRLNRPSQAIEFYKKALAVDPEFAPARRNLETLLRQQGLSAAVTPEYDNMIKKLEQLVADQKWPEALAASKEIVGKYPGSFKAKFYLANLLFTLGDYENSEKTYKELLSVQPANIVVLTNLALMFEKQGRLDESRSVWARIRQIDPSNKVAEERLKR